MTRPVLSSFAVHSHVLVGELRGELDLCSTEDFLRSLNGAFQVPVPAVVLDASQLEFLDCQGARALREAAKRGFVTGHRFGLAALRSEPRRVLALTGVDGLLTIFETVDEAVATLGGGGATPVPQARGREQVS